jgi:hypothetical protein
MTQNVNTYDLITNAGVASGRYAALDRSRSLFMAADGPESDAEPKAYADSETGFLDVLIDSFASQYGSGAARRSGDAASDLRRYGGESAPRAKIGAKKAGDRDSLADGGRIKVGDKSAEPPRARRGERAGAGGRADREWAGDSPYTRGDRDSADGRNGIAKGGAGPGERKPGGRERDLAAWPVPKAPRAAGRYQAAKPR